MAYEDQYVVYGYWEYDYCVGDVLATDGAGSVNGIGTAIAFPTVILLFSASITGVGSTSADGIRVALGDGSINGVGTVVSEGIRQALGAGSINGIGSISGLGNFTASGNGSIVGLGTVLVNGNDFKVIDSGSFKKKPISKIIDTFKKRKF